jgi:DNA topoisomerase IB
MDRLRDEKQRVIGAGLYAEVYQHPQYKKVVVKVGEENKRILNYIAFAVRNQNNPYVPKVYDIRRFRSRTSETYSPHNYFVLFLERLREYERLSNNTKRRILYQHVPPSLSVWQDMHKAEDFFMDVSMRDLREDLRELPTVRSQQLLKVLDYLHKSHSIDLHDANIMLRGKSQIVFTDPTT